MVVPSFTRSRTAPPSDKKTPAVTPPLAGPTSNASPGQQTQEQLAEEEWQRQRRFLEHFALFHRISVSAINAQFHGVLNNFKLFGPPPPDCGDKLTGHGSAGPIVITRDSVELHGDMTNDVHLLEGAMAMCASIGDGTATIDASDPDTRMRMKAAAVAVGLKTDDNIQVPPEVQERFRAAWLAMNQPVAQAPAANLSPPSPAPSQSIPAPAAALARAAGSAPAPNPQSRAAAPQTAANPANAPSTDRDATQPSLEEVLAGLRARTNNSQAQPMTAPPAQIFPNAPFKKFVHPETPQIDHGVLTMDDVGALSFAQTNDTGKNPDGSSVRQKCRYSPEAWARAHGNIPYDYDSAQQDAASFTAGIDPLSADELKSTLRHTGEALRDFSNGGTTASLLYVGTDGVATGAHVGDSPMEIHLYSPTEGKVVEVVKCSADHSPEAERERVVRDGGFVDHGRVGGEYGMKLARALGDKDVPYKGLSAEPDAISVDLKPYFQRGLIAIPVVASDGLDEKAMQQERSAVIERYMAAGNETGIAQALVDLGDIKGSTDNISVHAAVLKEPPKQNLLFSIFDGHGPNGATASNKAKAVVENSLMHRAPSAGVGASVSATASVTDTAIDLTRADANTVAIVRSVIEELSGEVPSLRTLFDYYGAKSREELAARVASRLQNSSVTPPAAPPVRPI